MSRGKQCSCKKGYASSWDGACGNCRSKQQQEWHNRKLSLLYKIGEHRENLDWHRMYHDMDNYGQYDEFKRILNVIIAREQYFKTLNNKEGSNENN